jgi:hypothetical protein
MTNDAVDRFQRISKAVDSASVQLMEDLKSVWDDPGEVSKILTETRDSLGAIYFTLQHLEKGMTRVEQLQVRDRRKHLRVVKGHGQGGGMIGDPGPPHTM